MYYICVFFILFPFLIGALVACHRFVPWDFAGEPKDWLSFWGSYISGIATFIVIFISIKQHKDLKKLQIDILLLKTVDIRSPKTGISVHFSVSLS